MNQLIRFGYHTFLAEKNAMPCLPDEFEIVVLKLDVMASREPLHPYSVDGYHCETRQKPSCKSFVIRYWKRQPRTTGQLPVHDILLQRMCSQMSAALNES